ncbi:MAG: efflux RND transporter periplasmic adaptor subunit [Bacteroides sp.]|nr:efflux RND transporter periplasmic adaptor subunit [Bacteroides sp.]
MNKYIYYILAATLPFYIASCNHSSHDDDHHSHNHGHTHEHAHAHNHGHDGEDKHEDGVIELEPDDADFLGVKVSTIELQPFNDVLHTTGVIESAPTDVFTAVSKSSGIVSLNKNLVPGANVSSGAVLATINSRGMSGGDPNEAAYQNMMAAKRELDRITPLHRDDIVSTREYNQAEADYNRAKTAYSGAQSGSQVVSNISGIVTQILVADGDFVEAGTPIATVAKGKQFTLRADVPVRYLSNIGDKMTGNVRFVGIDRAFSLDSLNAKRQSANMSTMNGAYMPLYFTIDRPSANLNLVPGMTADIYLTGNGDNRSLVVPIASVSEQQGAYFVYVRLDEDCYRKTPVTLGRNDGVNVEILSGLQPGQDIVTGGMIFVKLAESNGAVPEGHTHNH